MNIARLFFILLLVALVLHFKNSFTFNKEPPNAMRGIYAMDGTNEGRTFALKFVDDTHVQVSPDGKTWGELQTYNVFDDNVYVYNKREVWDFTKSGATLRRKDFNWVFVRVPGK